MSSTQLLNAVLKTPHLIRAELSGDWSDDGMPTFQVNPDGVRLKSVRHADYSEFAESSGYYREQDTLHFFCNQNILAQHPPDESVFIAGDFNGWGEAIGQKKWKLSPEILDGMSGLGVSILSSEIDFSAGTSFKFVSKAGHWFSLPPEASNTYRDSHGNTNYYVDHNRTGRHLLLMETSEAIDLSEDHFLSLQAGEQSSCAITPGAFFLATQTKLSLGARPRGKTTLFRLFAPRASAVTLLVLSEPDDAEGARRYPLIRLDDGAWEVVIDENLTGKFYWYRVDGPSEAGFSHCDPEFNILDPYALASVDRLGPAIVIDKNAYPPPQPFQKPAEKDLIIGEVHVRDLIARAHLEPVETDRHGFAGLTQWLQSDGCYLKEWGVNAVEFQPIQENDARSRDEYHWGYMTVNFFSPESSYGSDPVRGSQVREFKELVDALHGAGLAVILDVVYNHVGEPAHLLFVDKFYYFEQTSNGEMSNWSGCGNDLRCSTPMAKRLIIDSLLHLIEFYGVDGFRFDLAELIGLETLNEIEAVVKAKHPDVFLIAEPWSFRGHLGSDLKNSSYFSWNDGFRDFLKQYVKAKGDRDSLAYFLKGSPESAGRPCQAVNYTESHDDRTWLDDITENRAHNGHAPLPIDRRRTHLMMSILMMSLGTPMLAEGQDFLRSKWGVTNTYQRGDLNALDYWRRLEFSSTHSYFRRWMEFRKSPEAACLRLDSYPDASYFRFFPASTGSGLGVLVNASSAAGTCRLFFAVNPMTSLATFKVEGLGSADAWTQVADSERFDAQGLESALLQLKGKLEMPPVSCALWIERNP